MGLRIGTNVPSLTASRNLRKATDDLVRNYERLASGKRIARASDDAAGLAISSRLTARIRSMDQAARNAQDGISLTQIAEGSLGEIENSLIRMRELAVQSANGTLGAAEKDALDSEFSELIEQVDQIAGGTQFNGISLLSSSGTITLQVGPDNGAANQITLNTVDVRSTGASIAISALDIGSGGNTATAITTLDTAIGSVAQIRASLGSVQSRLNTSISALEVQSENLAAANSRILDVDVAKETAELTRNNILQQVATSILAQANVQPAIALTLLQA